MTNLKPKKFYMYSIMLVDDKPAIMEGLKALIESTGIALVVATETDGAVAIERLLEKKPDLVLLDVSMPKMNGVEVARKMRAECADIPILAVSAHANSVYVRNMLSVGARGYMLKDHISQEVEAAIQTIMNGGDWFGQGLPEIDMDDAAVPA